MNASDASRVAPAGTGTVVDEFALLEIPPCAAHPAMFVDGDEADCVTVNVRPAMVAVPERSAPVEFAAQETVTDPLPVALVGLTVSQLAELDAVHAHEAALALTPTEPLHAAAPADTEDEDRE